MLNPHMEHQSEPTKEEYGKEVDPFYYLIGCNAPSTSSDSSDASGNTYSNVIYSSTNNANNMSDNNGRSSNKEKEQNNYLNLKPIQENILGFKMYNGLSKVGVCVIDNFLKEDTANNLYVMVNSLSSLHGLLHDPMLNTPGQFREERFRDDYMTWLSGKENGCEGIQLLEKAFHKILKVFLKYSRSQNRFIELSHKSLVQVSCFPTRSMGYKIHSDNPNNNGRILTFVYHCNNDYQVETHSGSTRFHINNKFADVIPKYNRLVIYWSNSILEILPCKNTLYSLTTWYFGKFLTEPNTNLSRMR